VPVLAISAMFGEAIGLIGGGAPIIGAEELNPPAVIGAGIIGAGIIGAAELNAPAAMGAGTMTAPETTAPDAPADRTDAPPQTVGAG